MAAPSVRNRDRIRGSRAHSRRGGEGDEIERDSTEVSKSNGDEVRRQTWARKVGGSEEIFKGHFREM